jgi:hypothetical protein
MRLAGRNEVGLMMESRLGRCGKWCIDLTDYMRLPDLPYLAKKISLWNVALPAVTLSLTLRQVSGKSRRRFSLRAWGGAKPDGDGPRPAGCRTRGDAD